MFFRHDALAHLAVYSVVSTWLVLCTGNTRIHLTHFIAILALLRWSGTKPEISDIMSVFLFLVLSKPSAPLGHYTPVPIISLTSMAILLLPQNHLKHTEYLPGSALIIFQHAAQDSWPSRTAPAPFPRSSLGRERHPYGLTCVLHSLTTCNTASPAWVLSFPAVSRSRMFSRPSEELTALSKCQTQYHACLSWLGKD